MTLRGDGTAVHEVRRPVRGTQARCAEAGPGSESGAKAHGGILESWERRTDPSTDNRIRTTPVYQRPGVKATFLAAVASKARGKVKDSGSEGNRSERGNGGGSLSGLIVATESRRTNRREPVSSEGDRRGEKHVIEQGIGEFQPQSNATTLMAHSLRERILSLKNRMP